MIFDGCPVRAVPVMSESRSIGQKTRFAVRSVARRSKSGSRKLAWFGGQAPVPRKPHRSRLTHRRRKQSGATKYTRPVTPRLRHAHRQRRRQIARKRPRELPHRPARPATPRLLRVSRSVFLYVIGILPILAVVFSGVGLAKAQSRNGQGQVAAWIGLILGIIYTIMYLAYYGHLAQ
jgi:hypothetical protein